MKKQKTTKKNSKKETKRSKVKYPALNKGVNLSSRKDYIEPDYINGVFNVEGKKVIRSLNKKEKEWLNQFYEETVVTNFYHDPELKTLNKLKKHIIEDETVKTLKEEIKKLELNKSKNKERIRELKEIVHITKKQNEETYSDKLFDIEEELNDLRKEKLLYPDKEDHKTFYNENNSRNNCLFNKSRISGKLVDFDITSYDDFVYNHTKSIDIEDLLIVDIEGDVHDSLDERIDEIILESLQEVLKKNSES